MKTVLVTGVSVIDFIFQLDEIPKTYEKFRANDAFITGGGPAANAAVAVSRLGGSATLASRLGKDEIAKLIKSDLANEGVNTNYIKQPYRYRQDTSFLFIDHPCCNCNDRYGTCRYYQIGILYRNGPLWIKWT